LAIQTKNRIVVAVARGEPRQNATQFQLPELPDVRPVRLSKNLNFTVCDEESAVIEISHRLNVFNETLIISGFLFDLAGK